MRKGRPMQTDAVFGASIPLIYDRFLGPLIFESYAADLARRAAVGSRAVLETAAGTGVLTRALIGALPSGVRVAATDLNQPMLDLAATRVAGARVEWRQADALRLPFADASFDTVLCQFGVMFFPDRVAGYREALRVLTPGGRFLFNVWRDIRDNELADTVTRAVAALFPGDPPNFLARTPHGHDDPALIRRELHAAGFAQVTIETIEHRSRAPSPREPAIAYCQGTPLRSEIEARAPERLAEATEAAAAAIAARFGNGPIDAKIAAHVIEAAKGGAVP
jgi:ubiquinone/menaquinone biosynthesis C-methylase UbiE